MLRSDADLTLLPGRLEVAASGLEPLGGVVLIARNRRRSPRALPPTAGAPSVSGGRYWVGLAPLLLRVVELGVYGVGRFYWTGFAAGR
jgi:hypothetical protein